VSQHPDVTLTKAPSRADVGAYWALRVNLALEEHR